jgi:hypothetical protein
MTTGNMGLCCHPVSYSKVGRILAHLDHLSRKFVTKKKGKLNSGCSILVPLVNVDICSTNGGSMYFHQQVIFSNLRDGETGVCGSSDRFVFD